VILLLIALFTTVSGKPPDGFLMLCVPGRVPSLCRVLSHVMQTRTGRVGIIVAWAWVGLHFFAR
jgi:hypothetical protein